MKPLRLYHNPQCSKSREALQILETEGVDFEVVEYLKTPPTRDEIKHLIRELRGPIAELVRAKEPEFLAHPFDVNDKEVVAERIAKIPRLLERPILWGPKGAIVGRPIERIVEALEISR